MRVTTWTLEMLFAPTTEPRAAPEGFRVDRAPAVTPEYARFLYGLVGGPWRWTDRLGWTRAEWSAELDVVGTEFWVVYGAGVPQGYVHLRPQVVGDRSEVEIRYFGLAEYAIGHGLGRTLLEQGIDAAWGLSDRFDLPPVGRVWVHTCSLDGPAALANYRARGLEVCATVETDEDVPEEPLGSWISTGGPASGA